MQALDENVRKLLGLMNPDEAQVPVLDRFVSRVLANVHVLGIIGRSRPPMTLLHPMDAVIYLLTGRV